MANEDREYTDHLHGLPCALSELGECMGAVCVHHAPGHKGMGQTNPDDTGKPLCARHHTDRHFLCGYFAKWRKAELKAWERATAERYRQEYLK